MNALRVLVNNMELLVQIIGTTLGLLGLFLIVVGDCRDD